MLVAVFLGLGLALGVFGAVALVSFLSAMVDPHLEQDISRRTAVTKTCKVCTLSSHFARSCSPAT